MTTVAKMLRRFDGLPPVEGETPTQRVQRFLDGLTPAVAYTARAALRQRFNGSLDWSALRLPPRYTRNEARLRRTVLSPADYARLRRAPLTPRERALIALLHVLRRCEIPELRWADVDVVGGLVYVRRGKGGTAAWTVMPPPVIPPVAAWRQLAGEAATPESLVFPGSPPFRKAVHVETVGWWVRLALRKAGVTAPHRGPHAFRRSFATAFLRANPSCLRQLQVLMRHASIGTTVLYDYPEPGDFTDALGRMVLG